MLINNRKNGSDVIFCDIILECFVLNFNFTCVCNFFFPFLFIESYIFVSNQAKSNSLKNNV